MGSRTIASIDDLRRAARRRLPRMVFDYVDGGARAELTMADNRSAFDEVQLRPRMAVRVPAPDLATTVLGRQVSMPLLLSPCGGLRAVHPNGEIGCARAAHALGTVFTLSSASGTSIEDVAGAAPGPNWFQLYFLGGRRGAEVLIDRAKSSGYEALVVTVDTGTVGLRERDIRNGMTAGPQVNARNIRSFAPQVVLRPRWLAGFIRDGMAVKVANNERLGPDGGPLDAVESSVGMIREAPTWDDLAWVRERWGGPFVVKGVLSADDARRAVDAGADAVVVSNHGGRQLDGAPATLRVLPSIVDGVDADAEVLLDSGVRRGSDIIKAVALGARAVMAGRAYIWGLAVRGEPGVSQALQLLQSELANAMQLLGCPAVSTLNPSWLLTPSGWERH
jgi:isopentenyl diphosphate isomerase/L-lactate dehydrogenase-like FMN-dependent dehydrogenase